MDDIREFHAKIRSGKIKPEEAAKKLSARSEGGLTIKGAMDVLSRKPEGVKSQYEGIFQRSLEGMDTINSRKARDKLNGPKGRKNSG